MVYPRSWHMPMSVFNNMLPYHGSKDVFRTGYKWRSREVSLRSLSKRSLKRSWQKIRKETAAGQWHWPDHIQHQIQRAASMDHETEWHNITGYCHIESDIKPLKTPKSKKKLRFNNNVTKSPLDAKLPVKKRKIAFAQDHSEKWVGNLTLANIENNKICISNADIPGNPILTVWICG